MLKWNDINFNPENTIHKNVFQRDPIPNTELRHLENKGEISDTIVKIS